MTPDNLTALKALTPQLTFGLEVEQSGIAHSNRTALMRINTMFTGRERWDQVYDGSVMSGSEFVSGIMAYDSLENVQQAVRIIKACGGRPHSSCGIHVHIDGRRFIEDPKALIRLVKIVNKYESQLYHALGADTPERRGRWAQPVCQRFMARLEALPKNPTIDQVREAWYADGGSPMRRYDSTRYRGLNLHALFTKGTIEFRWFNATLHAGKIKAYIQLSALLVGSALVLKKASSKRRSFEPNKAKYEVRTMLLKIGAIGDEFKTLRFHMTRHLEGNASWHTSEAGRP